MADFTISIEDTLVPGIIATASLEEKTPEDVVAEYATNMATKVCQDLKVGPYYTGPTEPQFNPDGTPYDPEWVDPNAPSVDPIEETDEDVESYYTDPTEPQVNPDGTPYDPEWVDPNAPSVDPIEGVESYYTDPTEPQVNPDGTPYDPEWEPPVVDGEPDGGEG